MAIVSYSNKSQTTSYIAQRAHMDTAITFDATGGDGQITLNDSPLVHGKRIAVHAKSSGFDAVDATSQLQGSIDGTAWVDIGAAQTFNPANTTVSHSENETPWALFRLDITVNSVTTGSIAVVVLIKE